jgi:hypothetical protein
MSEAGNKNEEEWGIITHETSAQEESLNKGGNDKSILCGIFCLMDLTLYQLCQALFFVIYSRDLK